MEGSGEISTLRSGRRQARDLTVDASGRLRTKLRDLPPPYRGRMYGAQPKGVAITFDDGPDPSGPRRSWTC